MHKNTSLPSSGELFGIDEILCLQAAKNYQNYKPKILPEGNTAISTEMRFAFKLAFVSICHQINWDFLHTRLLERFELESGSVAFFHELSTITSRTFSAWFSDFPQPERIRAPERSQMLRSIGVTLLDIFDGEISKMIESSSGRLNGINGFFAILDQFEPYRKDPLRKKSNVLVHELIRERILRFSDEENIAPAIDYHLIRLYLRTGRVFPLHPETFSNLVNAEPRPRNRLVQLLRAKVSEAVTTTARFACLTVPDVNFIEWQLGRAVCIKGTPLCIAGDPPSSIDQDVSMLLHEQQCPHRMFCRGYADPAWVALQEPVFEKTFY